MNIFMDFVDNFFFNEWLKLLINVDIFDFLSAFQIVSKQ